MGIAGFIYIIALGFGLGLSIKALYGKKKPSHEQEPKPETKQILKCFYKKIKKGKRRYYLLFIDGVKVATLSRHDKFMKHLERTGKSCKILKDKNGNWFIQDISI